MIRVKIYCSYFKLPAITNSKYQQPVLLLKDKINTHYFKGQYSNKFIIYSRSNFRRDIFRKRFFFQFWLSFDCVKPSGRYIYIYTAWLTYWETVHSHVSENVLSVFTRIKALTDTLCNAKEVSSLWDRNWINMHVHYFDQFRFPGIKNVISRLEDIIHFS